MYKSSEVADKLRSMARLRGVSMASVLSDAGLSYNLMTNMRKSMPNATSLAKLADRLECSVDYLLGRTSEMLTPGADQTPPPVQEEEDSPGDAPRLSSNAAEMLELFELLPPREQVLFIGRLQEAVARTVGEGGAKGSGSSPVKAG